MHSLLLLFQSTDLKLSSHVLCWAAHLEENSVRGSLTPVTGTAVINYFIKKHIPKDKSKHEKIKPGDFPKEKTERWKALYARRE